MTALEQIRSLYEYNEWANHHVLATAEGLSEEEFGREQGASFGSVRGNLAHVVAGQIVWLGRWTSSPPQLLSELQAAQGIDAIRGMYETSHDGLRQFVASLKDGDLTHIIAYVDSRGEANERRLGQLMLHLANHGTHHRAETAMVLTSLGKPPRQLDYLFFELERA